MLGDSCYWQALQESGRSIRVSGSKGTRMQNQPAVCPPNPTYMNSTFRSRPTLRQVTKHCCMDKKPGGGEQTASQELCQEEDGGAQAPPTPRETKVSTQLP